MTQLAPEERRVLLDLLAAYCDGEIGEGNQARLETSLSGSRHARLLYVEFLDLHLALRKAQLNITAPGAKAASAGSAAEERPTVGRELFPKPASAISPLVGFLSLGRDLSTAWLSSPKSLALLVAGGLATYFVVLVMSIAMTSTTANRDPAVGSAPPSVVAARGSTPRKPPAAPVARLVKAQDCRWQPGSADFAVGAVLNTGRLRLAAGVAEFEFADGARVAMTGPGEIEFLSTSRAFLHTGQLAARVCRRAAGFTIVTPTAEVVDLGTEFSVDVDGDDETKLAVTEGAVKLTVLRPSAAIAAPPLAPMRVTAGQAMTVSRTASGGVVAQEAVVDATWTARFARPSKTLGERPHRGILYQTFPQGAAGNQFDFAGGLGLDFNVIRPIRIYRLGVFDHLGDGIDPSSPMTAQLWKRDTHNTNDLADDTGEKVLAEVVVSAEVPGELELGHRFVALLEPLVLPRGSYSIVAYGFSQRNAVMNFSPGFFNFRPELVVGLPDAAQSRLDTSRYAIVPAGARFHGGISPGTFPTFGVRYTEMEVAAGSFEFEEVEK